MQAHTTTSLAQTRPYDLIHPEKPAQNPQEMSSKESSNQRWKILFLTLSYAEKKTFIFKLQQKWQICHWKGSICSSTFGSYFIQNLLGNASQAKFFAFNVYERSEVVDKELIMGYLSFIPMIAGVMIHRFGIVKTFHFFGVLLILGSLLIVPSFIVKNYSIYLWGDSLMKGSSLVLWVAQIYMIIQWFKGKDLSLAIGVLSVSKCISYLIAIQLSSYLETIGVLKVLSFGVILSVFLAATFMKKIKMAAKQEDSEEEEPSLNQSAIAALMVTIVCFAVGESAKSLYFSLMFPSHSGSLMSIITKSENFGIYAPLILLPLFGSFADRQGGRKTAVFSSFLLLFIGNIVFYLFVSTDSMLIPLLASTLFQVGSYLFEASFWAILGSFIPKKALAVILGIGLSLKEFGPRFFGPFMDSIEKLAGFAVGIILIIGIKSMMYAWKEFKGKEGVKEEEKEFVKNDMNKREETI